MKNNFVLSCSAVSRIQQTCLGLIAAALCASGAMAASVIQLSSATYSVGEKEGSAIIPVTRAGDASGSVSVSFTTSNGTAIAGIDYTATNGSLAFADGQRSNYFTVPILDNALIAADKTFSVLLSAPAGDATLGRASSAVTIVSDDAGFCFSNAAPSIAEGNTSLAINVFRTGNTNTSVSVYYATSDGTAKAGIDYTSKSGTLNFSPGQTNLSFSVSILDDGLPGLNKTFNLTLSTPTGAILVAPSNAIVTIVEKDGPHIVTECTETALRNALALGGTIVMACDGTIELTNTLNITKNTSIDASGHTVLLNGRRAVKILNIGNVAFAMTNVVITNGLTGLISGGNTLLVNCTFASNLAGNGSSGSAAYNTGTLKAMGCSFINNVVDSSNAMAGNGGAISAGGPLDTSGPITLTNCTFQGNIASTGGALFVSAQYSPMFNGAISVVNCSFIDNIPNAILNFTTPVTVFNSLFKNTNSTCFSGPITDGGYNVCADGTAHFTHPFSMENMNPMVGVLGYYGGTTPTIPLLSNSICINAADCAVSPPVDQRGVMRPYGNGCDIGAFESTVIGTNHGIFQFAAPEYPTYVGQTNVAVTLLRLYGAADACSVRITSTGTATPNMDYIPTNGIITFAHGEYTRTVNIPLLVDPLSGIPRYISLVLSHPSGGSKLGSLTNCIIRLGQGQAIPCDEASLRTALGRGGLVAFQNSGTITLSNPIDITNSAILDGANNKVIIDGSNSVRHFNVAPGVTFAIKNLTLANGRNTGLTGASGMGGSIYVNSGTLQAASCIFTQNCAIGGVGGADGTGANGLGGAIYCYNGNLYLTNLTFTTNTALGGKGGGGSSPWSGNGGDALGGSIYIKGGQMAIHGCNFQNNHVVFGSCRDGIKPGSNGSMYGGAICNDGGSAVVLNSTLTGNGGAVSDRGGTALGGAIYQSVGSIAISRTCFNTNWIIGGDAYSYSSFYMFSAIGGGGAIAINSGIVNITNCTLMNNLARGGSNMEANHGLGGGLYVNTGTGWLENCTISGNVALGGYGSSKPGSGLGGGLFVEAANVTLKHVTVAVNKASKGNENGYFSDRVFSEGGAVFAKTNGATIVLQNTIVANSLIASNNCFGTIIDNGNNISSDNSGGFTQPGSRMNVNPLLGPLAMNGGTQPTMALLTGSPAIDTALPAYAVTLDQRGWTRPYGPACDIGAFEWYPTGFNNIAVVKTNGSHGLVFQGTPGQPCYLLQSSNLVDWVSVQTNTIPPGGIIIFTNSTPLQGANQYFKTKTQ